MPYTPALKLYEPEFKIVRPILRNNGLYSQIDPYVKKEIDLLNDRLSKKCLNEEFRMERYVGDTLDLDSIFKLDIDKLLEYLEKPNPNAKYSFSDLIDQKGDTSLFYQVSQIIANSKLSYNANKLLSEKPILAYLFCRAAYHIKLNTDLAVYNYISKSVDDGGIKLFYNYIIVEAAKNIIHDVKLEVGDVTAFIEGDGKAGDKLRSTNINFTAGTFTPSITSVIKELIYDADEYEIVNSVKGQLNIDDEDIPALVNYIKQSKVEINKSNASFFLSIALNDIRNTGISYLTDTSTGITDADFSVKYYEDEEGSIEIVRENIACAAQMYYVMTLGDELGIFNVINMLTTYYLPLGDIDISNKDTLSHLQSYVFNDVFKDQKGIEYKRTHPDERKMFYKQLFNAGGGETMEGMAVNEPFPTLLGNLLMEYARYSQKIETSENPTMFVSRQNICQAVEDLQYNLSTHCTGMTKVVSPIINKELDFIIEKFLKNDEIIQQLGLNNNRSFWKVIEKVYSGALKYRSKSGDNEVPNVQTLRSKAVLGHKLLLSIAEYTPGSYDDDKRFSEDLSTAQAFILANRDLEKGRNWESGVENKISEVPSSSNGKAVGEEWNF